MNVQSTEPVTLTGALELAAIGIATAVLLSLGEDIEGPLAVAILGAVVAVVRMLGIIITRSGVWSPASHEAEVEAALRTPVPEE